MQAYFWVKTLHIVFVTAWIAALFYLPRILVNVAEAKEQANVVERLQLMGQRLYRFGHVMFALVFASGLVLWLGYRVLPNFPTMVGGRVGWLHIKLTLVALLLAYFIFTGRWLKGIGEGKFLPSARALRWFNELPLLLFVLAIWLVVAKPV